MRGTHIAMPTAAEVIAELAGPGEMSAITTDTANGVDVPRKLLQNVLRGEGVVSVEETM